MVMSTEMEDWNYLPGSLFPSARELFSFSVDAPGVVPLAPGFLLPGKLIENLPRT